MVSENDLNDDAVVGTMVIVRETEDVVVYKTTGWTVIG